MARVRLDPVDLAILRELQADGRMTNVELSRRVGISAPPCLRRVRALEESGLIEGYHARLATRALGYEITVFALVSLARQTGPALAEFERRAAAWPIVRGCYMLNGDIDFLLRCVAPNLPAFQTFLTDELTAAPDVASVKTSLVIRAAKEAPDVPFELGDPGAEG